MATATRNGTAPSPGLSARGGRPFQPDDTHWLWLLVALELLATALLRRQFRNAHGG